VKQKKLDEVYINVAKQVSTLSHCVRSKVGAVLVKDGNIIAFGYNGTPSGMDNCCENKEYAPENANVWTDVDSILAEWPHRDSGRNYKLITKKEVIHAEVNAILKAAKTGASVDGSTLYLTLSPCLDCSKLILQAGIKRVVYLEQYRHLDGPNFLKQFIKVEKYEI
jgi:dCMP deaminase